MSVPKLLIAEIFGMKFNDVSVTAISTEELKLPIVSSVSIGRTLSTNPLSELWKLWRLTSWRFVAFAIEKKLTSSKCDASSATKCCVESKTRPPVIVLSPVGSESVDSVGVGEIVRILPRI